MYGCGAALPHNDLWDQRADWSHSRSSRCVASFSFSRLQSPWALPLKSRWEGLLWKRILFMFDKGNPLVSNKITQRSCILQLLITLRISPSPSLPGSFAASVFLKRMKGWHGALQKLKSFHLVYELFIHFSFRATYSTWQQLTSSLLLNVDGR